MTATIVRHFPPTGVTEQTVLGWDFEAPLTRLNDILSSSPSITVTVAADSLTIDPSPGALLTGVASISGTIVKQQKGAGTGLADCTYELRIQVTTSQGQVIEGRDDYGNLPRLTVVA